MLNIWSVNLFDLSRFISLLHLFPLFLLLAEFGEETNL